MSERASDVQIKLFFGHDRRETVSFGPDGIGERTTGFCGTDNLEFGGVARCEARERMW